MTDETLPVLSDADLFAWVVVLTHRADLANAGMRLLLLPFPPCPTCQQTVTEVFRSNPLDKIGYEWIRLTMKPCNHVHNVYDEALDRIQDDVRILRSMLATSNDWSTDDVVKYAQNRYPASGPGPRAGNASRRRFR